jgi:DNA polymerase zeta
MERACLNIDLLQSMDFFTKNSQMAQIYGIQFADVITRGSQFRVESMLFRLCKRQHFFAPSVSEEQRNRFFVSPINPIENY